MIKSLPTHLFRKDKVFAALWRPTTVDNHVMTAVILLGIMSSIPLMNAAMLDGQQGLWVLAAICLVLFVPWAVRNWDSIWDFGGENVYLVSVVTTVMAAAFAFLLMLFISFLGWLPITYSGPGTLSRISMVTSFIEAVEERNGQIPNSIAKGATSNATQRELFEANRLRRGLIYGKEFDRALLSIRLLGLDTDERYLQARAQGWMDERVLAEWGKTLAEHPPAEHMNGNPLYQQAYLRMIGEQKLSTPLGSEPK